MYIKYGKGETKNIDDLSLLKIGAMKTYIV
jgi:hypothetical protein